jgi:hypothetical protein
LSGHYYVSPSGTGTDCTSSAPCSITQAQTVVQAAVKTMQSNIIVELADGVYTLTAPLVFTAADSPPTSVGAGAPATDAGSNGPTVVWQAAAGAHPVISGAKKITGWTVSDSARRSTRPRRPASFATRQLYVDGKLATRARSSFDQPRRHERASVDEQRREHHRLDVFEQQPELLEQPGPAGACRVEHHRIVDESVLADPERFERHGDHAAAGLERKHLGI